MPAATYERGEWITPRVWLEVYTLACGHRFTRQLAREQIGLTSVSDAPCHECNTNKTA